MLYYCIGLARSGKSTFCEKWKMQQPNRVVVCADNIRLALHGQRFNSLCEAIVEGIKINTIRSQLIGGADVIVDGTHTTEYSIKKILEIDENAMAVLFTTPKEVCIDRAKATNQQDLLPVIDRMKSQMDKLLESDFFFHLNKVDLTRKEVFQHFYYGNV